MTMKILNCYNGRAAHRTLSPFPPPFIPSSPIHHLSSRHSFLIYALSVITDFLSYIYAVCHLCHHSICHMPSLSSQSRRFPYHLITSPDSYICSLVYGARCTLRARRYFIRNYSKTFHCFSCALFTIDMLRD